MGRFGQLLATAYDPVMRNLERGRLGAVRQELLAGAAGHVLDLGAGTGANLPHLGAGVDRVTAIEPDAGMARRLRRRAAEVDVEVEVIDATAEALPLAAGSVDVAVATLVLCTVANPAVAVAELRRVLRPEGVLVVVEHVADGDARRARLQQGLTPVWRRVAGGCHLDRNTRALLEAGGFDTSGVAPWQLSLRGPTVPALRGTARPR